jgi:hypothetical protein
LSAVTASAPPAKRGFFPLDDELELLPGRITPRLCEEVVHLATWMPFAQAAKHLKRSTRVDLSEPTARRHTLAAGAAYVTLQTLQADIILHSCPPCPCAPERVVVSVDGAMVPLRHAEWAEVKTLVVGEPEPTAPAGELHALSYFSRLSDAASFADAAVVETHRRGVAAAREVAGVVDGAEWLQGFLDLHCPGAVRILDFPHAVEHINLVGQAVFGAGTGEAKLWLADQCKTLKHEGGAAVVRALHSLVAAHPEAEGCRVRLAYLEKREKQMQYPAFEAAGWPLGSGVVESANKVVVEARLKGAGMRWERSHVDAMLALRNIVYSDRWDEAWAQIGSELRGQERKARQERREGRRGVGQVSAAECRERAGVAAEVEERGAPPAPAEHECLPAIGREKGRPAADHPWRRPWSKRQQARQVPVA